MTLFQYSHSVASSRQINVSFEFFPPVSDEANDRLWAAVERLQLLGPRFVSVTYGAGGSTRKRTLETVKRLVSETDLDVAAHLTCVDASKNEVDAVVRDLYQAGVRRFVALRGDPSSGIGGRYSPREDGYGNGAELVAGLKAFSDFDITVAAYPEKHPESPDFQLDIDLLKRKVDNGATRAITQFFFDNDVFEAFLERVRKAGIYIPIVPGILPIHHFGKVAGFAEKCGASIPHWLAERFEGLDNDPHTRELVAAAVAAEQVGDLTRRGVSDFHFYTMNRAELPVAVCRLIGIHELQPETGREVAA
ncbi:methylenetetrahydrofolate reductase [NAD(P)H] [Salaquimonas pukyongi]|uniref:methylenetetrahydrofolate reductase [NAD(P)H] n=1 Tax=Salaquimonas pukyongi TaxID=2712698 RepID=UPI00096BB51A|nr:methylenetetrahydrofolate reductase [NAD(P)H] [Salaquimonas pukyongi]